MPTLVRACLTATLVALALPATAQATDLETNKAKLNHFMELMVARKYGDMLSYALSDPVLKHIEKYGKGTWESSIRNIERLVSANSPKGLNAYELANERRFGTLAMKLQYFVKGEPFIYLWTFKLINGKEGWALARVDFDAGDKAFDRINTDN